MDNGYRQADAGIDKDAYIRFADTALCHIVLEHVFDVFTASQTVPTFIGSLLNASGLAANR